MRLDKFLSQLKYGSRNEIKKACKEGVVKVNDAVIKDASHIIDPMKDVVYYNDQPVRYFKQLVLMLNKPKGVVSANHDPIHKTVIDLLPDDYQRYDLAIAGRLDIDTEGLLILTNDGSLVHNIIHPKKALYKTYLVQTDKQISNIDDLLKPMTLFDGNQKPYEVLKPKIVDVNNNQAIIQIQEGKFHQVKRMFKKIGYEVIYLKRIAIHNLELDESLALGEVKKLTEEDIYKLLQDKD